MGMGLAVKITDAIKANGWSKKEFATKMGKRPTKISKWLAGSIILQSTHFSISRRY